MAGASGARYHLTVERLPERDWEWVAWRADATQPAVRSGVAGCSEDAVADAETALENLDRS
jgi:hypothetical protein